MRGITSERKQLKNLKAFVLMCFSLINEDDLKEVCNRTGLCMSTVRRLANGDVTLMVRYRTIAALGDTAGLQLCPNTGDVSIKP